MMSAMPAAERVFFAKSELNPAHVPHVAMKKSSTSTFLGAPDAATTTADRRRRTETDCAIRRCDWKFVIALLNHAVPSPPQSFPYMYVVKKLG